MNIQISKKSSANINCSKYKNYFRRKTNKINNH